MSTQADILDVHKAESKLRLKPHLVVPREVVRFYAMDGPLRISMKELFTEETLERLREMKLL